MPQLAATERFAMVTSPTGETASFGDDVATGLASPRKQLSCHWLYDAQGSRLFEQICDLPEYYLTRCEHEILAQRASEIASRFAAPVTLVELGSGSANKTRLLIEAFLDRHSQLCFAPIDISQSTLEQSAALLLEDYSKLQIKAFAGRYESGLEQLAHERDSSRLTLWLGSSVGNLGRAEAADFLRKVREKMDVGDWMLVGIDLRKDGRILERAYDDSQGVTADFNLNLLARINRELGGHFDMTSFKHRATWHESLGRVESHLVSLREQRVRIDELGRSFEFSAGEGIHTENSYKYSTAEIDELALAGGMSCEQQWLDTDGLYSLNLFSPAP
jgi:L-histidine N-alpha-methyltransferase